MIARALATSLYKCCGVLYPELPAVAPFWPGSLWRLAVEPYLLVAPAATAQGVFVNPQANTGPETAPSTAGYGLPPDVNSLQRGSEERSGPAPVLRGQLPSWRAGQDRAHFRQPQ